MPQFLEIVDKILRDRKGRAPATPATLLDRWATFVEWCEEGYRWDVSEYRNEIGVRNDLEAILSSPETQSFSELQELRLNVNAVDEAFRALLQPDCKMPSGGTWWEQGVLKCAGEAYAEYYGKAYGITVEIV